MKKEKRHAFGKDIYLLGVDADGTRYWLEAPSWDCGWYWGFGYVEVYDYEERDYVECEEYFKMKYTGDDDYLNYEEVDTNLYVKYSTIPEEDQVPKNATDICSHQHIEKFYGKWWSKSDSILTEVPFTDKEGWELSELFDQFYFLKEAAEMFGRGKAHTANTTINTWKKPDLVKEINEELIPMVTNRILEILNEE